MTGAATVGVMSGANPTSGATYILPRANGRNSRAPTITLHAGSVRVRPLEKRSASVRWTQAPPLTSRNGDTMRGRHALQSATTSGIAELRRAALRHIEQLENKSAADMGLTPADPAVDVYRLTCQADRLDASGPETERHHLTVAQIREAM